MLIHVPLTQIDDNPYQRRSEYGDVADLANDILRQRASRPDTLGLQQVPNGRLAGDDDGLLVPIAGLDNNELLDESGNLRPFWRVQLEFGHRRTRAFERLAKLYPEYNTIPVIIRDLDDEQMLNGVWSENRARRDLSAVEEAELLKLKLERSPNQQAVADDWNLARSTVTNRLRLLELPEEIQAANRQGKLSERQALSLATVVKIDQLANGASHWSDNCESTFGYPPKPSTYIQYAIDNNPTSDQIRHQAERMLTEAGRPLDPFVAKFETDDSALRQPLCKGCPMRISNRCLDADCLTQKKAIVIDEVLTDAADELGVTVSGHAPDFPSDRTFLLRNLWKQVGAASGTNFVIAWGTEKSGYRPFADDGVVWVPDSRIFDNEGREGIILGHRGDLPMHLMPEAEPEPNKPYQPSQSQLDEWSDAAKKYAKDAEKKAKAEFAEALHVGLDTDVIQALMNKPEVEHIDESGPVVTAFVDFMWERGRGIEVARAYGMRPWGQLRAVADLVGRAGYRPDNVLSVGSRTDELKRTAILALDYFWSVYASHYRWDSDEADKAIVAAASQLHAFGDDSPIVVEINRAIHRMNTEHQAKEEAAQQQESEDVDV